MEYTQALRLLALNDRAIINAANTALADDLLLEVEPASLALARIAALVAAGGSLQSYGALVEEALELGVGPDQIVGVMVGVTSIVGSAAVVAAAAPLALALGYDTEQALEDPASPVDRR